MLSVLSYATVTHEGVASLVAGLLIGCRLHIENTLANSPAPRCRAVAARFGGMKGVPF
jgi:hypothetical protein